MKHITTLGIDLAKSSFSIIGMNEHGKIVIRKTLSRSKLLPYIATLPPCLIGMEACSSSHYWAREFEKLGHTVGIMAAKVVEPFRKGSKNDLNDAEAICEAVRRPNIYFVPVKTIDQQAVLCLHRVRTGLVSERTALINQLRGLLSEFGLIIPKGKGNLNTRVPAILEDADNELPPLARKMISDIWHRIRETHEQILEYDRELKKLSRNNLQAKRLTTIPGVGDQTATAVIASMPSPHQFKNSRQFAAWVGLVPRQYSTGGVVKLGRITKRGDQYLRTCLVHGARAVIARLGEKQDRVSCWIRALIQRRGYLRAVVALAARNARTIWTLMVKQENYKVIPA